MYADGNLQTQASTIKILCNWVVYILVTYFNTVTKRSKITKSSSRPKLIIHLENFVL